MRISLTEWANANYSPDCRPCMYTLRVWAKSGRITDCQIVGKKWTASDTSVYCEQPASIPANCSPRVAGILRAA